MPSLTVCSSTCKPILLSFLVGNISRNRKRLHYFFVACPIFQPWGFTLINWKWLTTIYGNLKKYYYWQPKLQILNWLIPQNWSDFHGIGQNYNYVQWPIPHNTLSTLMRNQQEFLKIGQSSILKVEITKMSEMHFQPSTKRYLSKIYGQTK